MKIRDDEVVVSSVITIADKTDQGIASAYKSCEKNLKWIKKPKFALKSHLSNVSKFIGLEPVNGLILLDENQLEKLHIFSLQHTQARCRQTKKLFVRSVLATAIDDHVAHFLQLYKIRKKIE